MCSVGGSLRTAPLPLLVAPLCLTFPPHLAAVPSRTQDGVSLGGVDLGSRFWWILVDLFGAAARRALQSALQDRAIPSGQMRPDLVGALGEVEQGGIRVGGGAYRLVGQDEFT